MAYLTKKSRPVQALGIMGAALLWAAPASADMTLDEVLAIAYTNNPTIQAQREQVRSADEQIAEAFASFLPSVEVTGTITKAWTHNSKGKIKTGDFGFPGFNIPIPSSDSESNPRALTTTIDQPIFTGGRNVNAMKQVRASVQGNRAQLTDVEQQIFLQTVAAYMDVIANQSVVELNENNVKVLDQQRTATQDRFDVGELTRTDVAQAEARLSGVQSRLIAAEADLRGAEAALAKLIGAEVDALTDPATLPATPETEDTAQELARDLSPQVIAARAFAEAAKSAIKVAGGEWLPTVSVRAQLEYSRDTSALSSIFNQTTWTRSVSGVLNWKFFQGGAVLSRMRQAQFDAARARTQISEAERASAEAVTNAWTGLKAAKATIRASQAAVDANEIALEGVRQEADVGARTTLDVLDAEQELLDSRVTLVQARRNEVVATYQLLAATGQLTAGYLDLPVEQAVVTNRADGLFNFSSASDASE